MAFSELLATYRDEGMPAKRKDSLAPLTKRSYRSSLQAFDTYFVKQGLDPPAHEITRGQVSGFLLWRKRYAPNGTALEQPVSGRTQERDRAILHRLFGLAQGLEIVEANPVTMADSPTGNKREPVILSDDEYEALLSACDREARPMLWLYVLTLAETGARCDSEALASLGKPRLRGGLHQPGQRRRGRP
jgi:site-specific recombinase XerD